MQYKNYANHQKGLQEKRSLAATETDMSLCTTPAMVTDSCTPLPPDEIVCLAVTLYSWAWAVLGDFEQLYSAYCSAGKSGKSAIGQSAHLCSRALPYHVDGPSCVQM